MIDIKERLREAVQKLRRTPMAIADISPMLTDAADHIATLEQESAANEKNYVWMMAQRDYWHALYAKTLPIPNGWTRDESGKLTPPIGHQSIAYIDASTQSTDQQNVSINGGNIDMYKQKNEARSAVHSEIDPFSQAAQNIQMGEIGKAKEDK